MFILSKKDSKILLESGPITDTEAFLTKEKRSIIRCCAVSSITFKKTSILFKQQEKTNSKIKIRSSSNLI